MTFDPANTKQWQAVNSNVYLLEEIPDRYEGRGADRRPATRNRFDISVRAVGAKRADDELAAQMIATRMAEVLNMGSAWLPISAAPKNSYPILAWCPDIGMRVLEWVGNRGCWCLAGTDINDYEPTHYMAIPDGPK